MRVMVPVRAWQVPTEASRGEQAAVSVVPEMALVPSQSRSACQKAWRLLEDAASALPGRLQAY
jgi:hypothetical protein